MPLTQADLQRFLSPRYTLERELGGGSMAAVYLARDARHGRAVAIKVLGPEYTATLAAERFLREIAIAARLQHPHIVPLLDSGEVGGSIYLVMPFVEGESLRDRLTREGRLPIADVIRILSDVTDALGYAHQKGIIHRDIKPDNILLAGRHALVADFGVAKAMTAAVTEQPDLTQGAALGTPAYMAPEQVAGDPQVDHRVDLYALGIVGYEMLAGRPPFEGPTVQAILAAQMLDDPPDLAGERTDLPAPLDRIIRRALAKLPGDRWSSADEIAGALEPLALPSGGSTPASLEPMRRRWSLLGGLGGVAFLVIAILVFGPPFRARSYSVIGQRQATFTGRVVASALAPDGQSVAFIVDSARQSWLKVQDLRGGGAVMAASGRHFDLPTWSSDGAEIRVYSVDSGRVSIRQIPRLGGSGRESPAGGWSTLSPDGRYRASVAAAAGNPIRSPFVLIDMQTAESLTVQTDTGYWQSPPAWSFDSRWIAWSTERETSSRTRILITAHDARVATVVYQDSIPIGTPAWTPDGGLLFFRASGGVADLLLLRLDHDGKPLGPPELIQAGVQAGSSKAYTAFFSPVSVSADGSRILYTRMQTWSNLEFAAFEAVRRGEPPRVLTNGNADYHGVRMSPDGQRLALIQTDVEGTSLQVLPLAGGTPQTLGRITDYTGLSWSPDGSRLALVVTDRDSGVGLRIYHIGEPGTQSHYYGQVGDSPDWLDDSSLVVPGPGNRGLQLLVPARQSRIPFPGLDSAGWMLWERAAPGGNQIALIWNRGRSHPQGVFIYTRSDGSLRPLAGSWYLPTRWSTDGRSVYLVSYQVYADTTRVEAYPVSGGPPQLLGTFGPGVRVEDVSPDGRGALLIRRDRQSDGWLIDLARGRP